MTTFAQLSARLKNWVLVLGLQEGLVECATVCVKSVVILINLAEFDCIFKSLRIGCKDFVASGKFSHQKDNFEQMTKCYKINQEMVALKLEIRIKVKNCVGDFFENQ